MTVLEDVRSFIETNILHSDSWDASDAKRQEKAVNNASLTLYNYYGRYDKETRPIPVEAIAYQTLWVLNKDDSIKRTEQGVSYVNVSGMGINFLNIDRSIAPEVLKLLGRRIGRYQLNVEDTFRHRNRVQYEKRGY
ncbi:hypothetical protein Q9R38_25940 [Priestia aryabhattai]|uniref:hypothetical protein n=1 Tax=Priestia aryabhattai TaxID=412384 RepID=UPI002881800B|nr:hypothetical protein [Priestia aryabhattai]MDT0149985.1 hypothetical protein [Priestia aryabhattai]MDT0155555.1 hypothetical protein [Priestia aryabhattai]